MSSGFPPVPIYPDFGFDTNETLFLVYNTSETLTVLDNDAFAEEIAIRPQPGNKSELWADNGYANISGELFYYDAVNKNSENRVCRLRRCVRNLGGKPSQFNSVGTWVRGFVIAEHHNQLVDCVLLTENFIGENFSPDPATLDWRIRHLAAAPIISDDFGCPDIEFDFNILSSSSATGTLTSYSVVIQGNGSFELQFGDGNSTTITAGQHLYPPGTTIDPVVIVQNDNCQFIQTPNVRENPQTPKITLQPPPFILPVPDPPPIPPIIIPSIIIPPPDINIPPTVNPCFTFPSAIISTPINIPNHIDITPIHLPSQITITPINIPSQIIGPNIQIPSQINFNGPTMIPIGPAPPMPPIQVQPPNIPPIQVQSPSIPSFIAIESPNIPSIIPIVVSVHGVPNFISVVGGGFSLIHNLQDLMLHHNFPETLKIEPIPKLEIDPRSIHRVMKVFGDTFAESLKIQLPDFNEMKLPHLKVDWGEIPTLNAVLRLERPRRGNTGNMMGFREAPEFENVAFPDHIPISVPEIPPLQLEHDIPESISLKMPDIKDIYVDASSIPAEIHLLPPEEGLRVSVIPFIMPDIKFDTEALDRLSIPLKFPDHIPDIQVKFPDEMPTLKVEFPENMPTLKIEIPDTARIPLYYDGPPLPVQINLKIQDLAGEAVDEAQCFKIIPCVSK